MFWNGKNIVSFNIQVKIINRKTLCVFLYNGEILMITHTRKTLSNGKIIDIFDNIFTSVERSNHITIAQNSSYTLGSTTSDLFQVQSNTFFQSCLLQRENDWKLPEYDAMNFLTSKSFDPIRKFVSGFCDDRSWLLVSSPFSQYFYHTDTSLTDKKSLTLLYYLNHRWDKNWGGETLFENDNGECEVAINYNPGRIVLFDSTLSHRPAAISVTADEFRFTYVIQFKEIEFEDRQNYSNYEKI